MNIKKHLSKAGIGCIVLALLLSGSVAFTQPGGQGRGQGEGPTTDEFFQRFDTDSDDRLTIEEFPGPDDEFSKFDENSDGYIEKDEMTEVPPPPRGKR